MCITAFLLLLLMLLLMMMMLLMMFLGVQGEQGSGAV